MNAPTEWGFVVFIENGKCIKREWIFIFRTVNIRFLV